MTIPQRFKAAAKGFRTVPNSMGQELARQYARFGSNKPLAQNWSDVQISDREMYTGYPYAAIDRRANKVASLAKYNLQTNASDSIQAKAKKQDMPVQHPYIGILDTSTTFANRSFWYDISTYLDLEGVYYLLAVRTVGQYADGSARVGNVTEFQLLNPYNIRRIINEQTFEIGGYVETRRGMVREFPPQMIIEMRKLNPFSEDDPFAMSDAAKTAQYTLKQGGDYTRHSLKNNMAAPGIISTDVILENAQFQNFISRVTNQEKGLPLFGNGSGAIDYKDMQIDMDKAALKDISEINRQELFAVSGAGKTMLAIEESGTTRDTAEVQNDLFIEYHVLPQIELIVDALNQDYKVYYASQYASNKYEITVDNPLNTDKDGEVLDITIRETSYELYDSLVADGYDRDTAARFSCGEIGLDELGDPTNDPRPNPMLEAAKLRAANPQPGDPADPAADEPVVTDPKADKKAAKKKAADAKALADKAAADAAKKKQQIVDKINASAEVARARHSHTDEFDVLQFAVNELDKEKQGIVAHQQGALQNAVINIQGQVSAAVLKKVTNAKNEFDDQDDVIDDGDRNDLQNELDNVLKAFYAVVLPLFATSTMASRLKEFGGKGDFSMNDAIKQYIKGISEKVSDSHMNTIIGDLQRAVKGAYDDNVKAYLDNITSTGRAVTDEDLVLAREKALEGASQQKIIDAVTSKFSQISDGRAKAIARTETNRAFAQSQLEADRQFLDENDLTEQAYKQWQTQSDNPCPICEELEAQGPVPFDDNFADLGDTLTASYEDDDGKTKTQTILVDFTDIEAGDAHVNCSCIYVLLIQ